MICFISTSDLFVAGDLMSSSERMIFHEDAVIGIEQENKENPIFALPI